MKKWKIIVVLVVALLVLTFTTAAVSASITWDLDHDKVMYKYPHDETGSVAISAFGSEVWRVNNSAIPDEGIYFLEETWLVGLDFTDVGNPSEKFKIYIGSWEGSYFSSAGESRWLTFNSSPVYKFIDINVSGFTVPKGHYLGLKIESNTSVKVDIEGGDCLVLWSFDEPAYPGKLSAIVLTSAGLLALTGYVGWKRRRKDPQTK